MQYDKFQITSMAHVKTYFDALVDVVSFPRAMQYIKKSSEKAPVMHKLQSQARFQKAALLRRWRPPLLALTFLARDWDLTQYFAVLLLVLLQAAGPKWFLQKSTIYKLEENEDFKIRLQFLLKMVSETGLKCHYKFNSRLEQ